jgi:hypothetical protein
MCVVTRKQTMRKLAIFIVVLTIFLTVIPTAQAVTEGASLSGIQIFPQDNIWNVPIDTLPVDPKSAQYIGNMTPTSSLRLNYNGFPYNIVNGTQRKTNVSFRYAWASDKVPYPLPDPDKVLIEDSDSPVACTSHAGIIGTAMY